MLMYTCKHMQISKEDVDSWLDMDVDDPAEVGSFKLMCESLGYPPAVKFTFELDDTNSSNVVHFKLQRMLNKKGVLFYNGQHAT